MINNAEKKSFLIVISGPSGVGKDTIIKKLMEKNKSLALSVSATTRTPRLGEIHGKDYYFFSKQDFQEMIEMNGLLEYAEYCGNYYGTIKCQVENLLNQGINVILEIEVCGYRQVQSKMPNLLSIFIVPPSIDSLYLRLKSRKTDDELAVKERIIKARSEISLFAEYDYIVVNDNMEKCTDDILDIINVNHMSSKRMRYFIEEIIKNG